MSTGQPAPTAYTIDELAAASGVPGRTIRFYQSKGALPSPQIKGRVAYYGDAHLERLRLIATLQDRGLRIDAIRDLVTRIDKGELDIGEWLGMEQQLQAAWVDDRPRTATEDELYELCGKKRVGLVADLVRMELVERHGDTFLVKSPALLLAAMKLESAGIDLVTAAGASKIMRRHLARLASEVAEYFLDHLAASASDGALDLEATFRVLRPVGTDTVRVVFGQEMERVLRGLVESGKTAKLPRRRKPKA